MSNFKIEIVASIIGAISGALATAVLANISVIQPIKSNIKNIQEENIKLKNTAKRFRYGEKIEKVEIDNFVFEFYSAIQTGRDLTVKFLVNNLEDHDRKHFKVYRDKIALQTDALEVFTPDSIKIYNSSRSTKSYFSHNIPQNAKFIPVEITFKNIKKTSNFISMFTVPIASKPTNGPTTTIVFSDQKITES